MNSPARATFPRRMLWPGMPVAVLLGLSVHLIIANLVGRSAGDYAGFAVTMAVITWFMSDDRTLPTRYHAGTCAAAALVGVVALYALRQLPF